MGLILLIIGIVLWAVTKLTTLGIVVTVIGGVIVAFQVIVFVAAAVAAITAAKKMSRRH